MRTRLVLLLALIAAGCTSKEEKRAVIEIELARHSHDDDEAMKHLDTSIEHLPTADAYAAKAELLLKIEKKERQPGIGALGSRHFFNAANEAIYAGNAIATGGSGKMDPRFQKLSDEVDARGEMLRTEFDVAVKKRDAKFQADRERDNEANRQSQLKADASLLRGYLERSTIWKEKTEAEREAYITKRVASGKAHREYEIRSERVTAFYTDTAAGRPTLSPEEEEKRIQQEVAKD